MVRRHPFTSRRRSLLRSFCCNQFTDGIIIVSTAGSFEYFVCVMDAGGMMSGENGSHIVKGDELDGWRDEETK